MSADTAKTPVNQLPVETRIFVYGSLKQGYALHSLLADQRFLGNAHTTEAYRLFDCGHYPALVKVSDNGQSIFGEVFEIDRACLNRLDEAEGVQEGLYERSNVCLQQPYKQQTVQAYFYLRSTSGLRDCGQQWPSVPKSK